MYSNLRLSCERSPHQLMNRMSECSSTISSRISNFTRVSRRNSLIRVRDQSQRKQADGLTFQILIVDDWVLVPPARRLPSECLAAVTRVVVWKRVKLSGNEHVSTGTVSSIGEDKTHHRHSSPKSPHPRPRRPVPPHYLNPAACSAQ
jgi:hypothetical protein